MGRLCRFPWANLFVRATYAVGKTITASMPEFQATIKSRWPDGSAKFAVLSGRATLSANVERELVLQVADAVATASSVSLAELRATGIVADIPYGSYGSATWQSADWDTPFLVWVVGPQMSSWIYRKPIGGDAHLVGWLEVRCFAGGAVEVVPWLENGYLSVASPGSRSGTATFTLGGTQRFRRR